MPKPGHPFKHAGEPAGRRTEGLEIQEFLVRVGRALQQIREHRELPQATVARSASISQSQLSKIEHGKSDTDLDTLERIAAVLETPPWQVLALAAAMDGSATREQLEAIAAALSWASAEQLVEAAKYRPAALSTARLLMSKPVDGRDGRSETPAGTEFVLGAVMDQARLRKRQRKTTQ